MVRDSITFWFLVLQDREIVQYVQLSIIVFNVIRKIHILVQFVRIVFMFKLMDNVELVIQIVLHVKVQRFVLHVNLDGLFWRILLKEFVWLVKDLVLLVKDHLDIVLLVLGELPDRGGNAGTILSYHFPLPSPVTPLLRFFLLLTKSNWVFSFGLIRQTTTLLS